MGIFDFLKRKENNTSKTEKEPIKCNQLEEYVITFSDFTEKEHLSEVLENPIISSEFEKEFAHLIVGKPLKNGEIISLKYYSVFINIWEQIVELIFETENENKERFVEKINSQLNWLSKNRDYINENITQNLLNLKNENWLYKNELPKNKTEFIKLISLKSINFIQSSAFNLNFEDGNLFDGHSIEVRLNSKREVKKVLLEG